MHSNASRRRSLAVAALSATLAMAGSAHAQSIRLPRRVLEEREVTVGGGHATLLGANLLVSGVTGGVLRWYRGGSFLEGFVKGASGGAAIYAGKALAVGNGTAAPLLGRQLAAVGASVTRNVGAGEPMLSRLSLPLGPLRLHIRPAEPRPASLSVDLLGVAGLAAVLLTYDATVDWEASLASAAPVFRVHDPEDRLEWNGRHVAGIVMVRDGHRYQEPAGVRRTLAHERVHLLQYDQMALLWSEPTERALLGNWQWTRAVHPYVDLGLNASLSAAMRLLPVHASPIEIEAVFLTHQH